jgi:hypothetical protein
MADLDHLHDEVTVYDRVDDPVYPLSDTISIQSRELLGALGTRGLGEILDAYDDPLSVLLGGNGVDLF